MVEQSIEAALVVSSSREKYSCKLIIKEVLFFFVINSTKTETRSLLYQRQMKNIGFKVMPNIVLISIAMVKQSCCFTITKGGLQINRYSLGGVIKRLACF